MRLLIRAFFILIAGVVVSAQAPATATQTTTGLSTSAPGSSAAGSLLVAPTRIILQGTRRTAQVTLINTSTAPATYRISFVELRMKPDGGVDELSEPDPKTAASPLIRYSPRQVTLDPRVAQTIRLQVRKPADLPAGEYRSHLLFRAIPNPDDAILLNDPKQSGINVRLIPIYGVSIPIIVRQGETTVSTQMNDLSVRSLPAPQSTPVLELTIHRRGNRSIYGNLEVMLANGGREQLIGSLNGLAVYVPLESRKVTIPLVTANGVLARGARLHVTLRDAEQSDSGGEVIAEATLELP